MSQNLVDIEELELKTWPGDWDLHIARAFRSYLKDNDDSLDLAFETATFMTDRFVSSDVDISNCMVRIVFKLKGKRWTGAFRYDGEYLFCDVDYVIGMKQLTDEEKEQYCTYPKQKTKLYMGYKIRVGTVVETDLVQLIKSTKDVIWADYWEKGDRGDDGDDDNDIEPEPSSPVVTGKQNLIKV